MRKYTSLFLGLFTFCSFSTKAQVANILSKEDKVFGLSKFWQEANYNFIYLDKIDRTKWDSAYRIAIGTVQATTDDYEYYRELQRFCALLKDGHTNVYMPERIDSLVMNSMFGKYKLLLTNIEGKAIIT